MRLSSISEALEARRALEHEGSAEDIPKIHVDEIASKVAAFYERARNIIDYREEHLFRKGFIGRALKRRLSLQGQKNVAEPLIKDVIRAGHLPNDQVPETRVADLAPPIATFLEVREALRGEALGERRALTDWFFRITTSAIEEILFPPVHDRLIADFMVSTIRENLTVRNANLDDRRLATGVFVGVERALLRADEDQIRWHLFRFLYPEHAELDPAKADEIVDKLPEIERTIEKALADPKGRHFVGLAHRWAPAYTILGDVVRDADRKGELPAVIHEPEELEARTKEAYKRRFRRERSKLRRFAFFTVLSFFISKIAIALAVEIPIQNYLNEFSVANTVANVLFPPLLMLFIVAFIRMPSRKNEGLVVQEVRRLVFDEHPREYVLKFPKKRSAAADVGVRLFYIGMFFVSIYILYRLLSMAHFGIADIVIFILFTSLVGAAGVKVHNRAREISLEERKPKILGFALDIFAIPFITIGKWIISGLSRFNVFVVAVDLFIDLPFQIFVEFLEHISDFVRSRKEALN